MCFLIVLIYHIANNPSTDSSWSIFRKYSDHPETILAPIDATITAICLFKTSGPEPKTYIC